MINRRLSTLGLLLVATSLQAQENVGVLVGVVKDRQGNPIAGATLVLSGEKALGGRRVLSGANGSYRIPFLLPGTYTVSASKADYVGSRATLSITAGQTARQEFSLKAVETAAAVVVVTDNSAVVDKSSTTTSSTMTAENLVTLPVSMAVGAGAAVLAPGVFSQGDSTNSIRGGVSNNVNATLDGISIREPARGSTNLKNFTLTDLIENFTVVQSPMNAKYGNSSSGAFVTVSKTGTNTFTGTLRANLSRGSYGGAWEAYGAPAFNRWHSPLSGDTVVSNVLGHETVHADDLSKNYEVSLLGPILKDKLTFTYGTRIQSPLPKPKMMGSVLGSPQVADWSTYLPGVVGPDGQRESAGYLWGADPNKPTAPRPFPTGSVKEEFNQYKLFWQINSEHQMEGNFVKWTRRDSYWYDGLEAASSNPKRSMDQTVKSLSYRGVISATSFLELKMGRRETEEKSPAGYGDPISFLGFTAKSNPTNLFDEGNADFANSFLANGNMSQAVPAKNVADTALASYKLILGSHELDAGLELLKESYNAPKAQGIHSRAFYAQGRRYDGAWMAYNYWGSPADTDFNLHNRFTSNGFVTEMKTWANSTDGDPMGRCQTQSAFLNDFWQMSPHWSLMGGLRLDRWTVKDLMGTRIKSSDLSPRMEVKWDPFGDSSHLLSLSYGHFRGSFAPSRMRGYMASSGSAIRRYFWNEGATTLHGVSQEALLTPANYSLYSYQDTNLLYRMDRDMKPDLTRQVDLTYRHAFQGGGSVRASLVYRRMSDLFTSYVRDEKVDMVDPSLPPGSPIYNGIRYVLAKDPNSYYDFRSVELEWDYPLLKGETTALNFAGNWVYARDLGRTGPSGSAFYDKLDQLGVGLDLYNPYGLREPEQQLKAWLVFSHTMPAGTRTTLSLLGTYITGQPLTYGQTYTLPKGTFNPDILSGRPSTMTLYPQGRGSRTSLDTYTMDLRWTLEIPLYRKLALFTDLTISNVFDLNVSGSYNVAPDGTRRTWALPGAGTNDMGLRMKPKTASELATVGVGANGGVRTYTLSTGVKF